MDPFLNSLCPSTKSPMGSLDFASPPQRPSPHPSPSECTTRTLAGTSKWPSPQSLRDTGLGAWRETYQSDIYTFSRSPSIEGGPTILSVENWSSNALENLTSPQPVLMKFTQVSEGFNEIYTVVGRVRW